MKRKASSIKWKICFYLLGFGAVLLTLLWIFQVVLLDDFYKAIKTRTVTSSSDAIITALQNGTYEDQVTSIATQNDICVAIYDENQQLKFHTDDINVQCRGVSQLKKEELEVYIQEALSNDGKTFSFHDTMKKEEVMEPIPVEGDNHFISPKNRFMQGMTQVSVVSMDESQWSVFVYSQVTPVDATVGTIRTQLIIITAILFVFSILLAFIMSRKIAKPIIAINESAKQLAKGNYDVTFQGKGYSEIKELNDTLTYASKELVKVEKLRQDLIANMSHDLRTPLTMISGYGEMMRDIPNENSPENIQIIVDEANRLTSMVNDILDLSKIQAGTQELSIRYFNMTDMLLHDMQRYQKMLEHDGYEFEVEYDEETYVNGDESKLNQVIYNLLNNAIHYCGIKRKIKIRQTNVSEGVKIEVIDYGEGISEEDLPYVWDRYYKVDKTHERSQIGSGLGLSIVKGILELHHCKYGVISKLKDGTTFWFILPHE